MYGEKYSVCFATLRALSALCIRWQKYRGNLVKNTCFQSQRSLWESLEEDVFESQKAFAESVFARIWRKVRAIEVEKKKKKKALSPSFLGTLFISSRIPLLFFHIPTVTVQYQSTQALVSAQALSPVFHFVHPPDPTWRQPVPPQKCVSFNNGDVVTTATRGRKYDSATKTRTRLGARASIHHSPPLPVIVIIIFIASAHQVHERCIHLPLLVHHCPPPPRRRPWTYQDASSHLQVGLSTVYCTNWRACTNGTTVVSSLLCWTKGQMLKASGIGQ